jgi:hypothetical protein
LKLPRDYRQCEQGGEGKGVAAGVLSRHFPHALSQATA